MSKIQKLSWDYCQNYSDQILADTTWKLINSPIVPITAEYPSSPGVYLFSKSKIHYYIGQADNLKKRIKQQISKRSTFFKNYLRNNVFPNKKLRIDDFELRLIKARIGRKELEEFGMVNLETNLNKFHKDKRSRYTVRSRNGIFDDIQSIRNTILDEGEEKLFSLKRQPWKQPDLEQGPGIYYVSNKNGDLIYLGESTNIHRRHYMHSNRTYMSALRRHIGTDIFGFKFIGKKKFSADDDKSVSNFLHSCTVAGIPISFGRLELEEFLIRKHQPLLNRKAK